MYQNTFEFHLDKLSHAKVIIDEWMDTHIGRWMDEWMDGWTDGQIIMTC